MLRDFLVQLLKDVKGPFGPSPPPEQGRNAAGFSLAAIEGYEGSPRKPFPRRSAERAVEQRRLELLARWLAGNSLAGCFPELAHRVRLQEQR